MKHLAIALMILLVFAPKAAEAAASSAPAAPAALGADGSPHAFVVDGKQRSEIPVKQAYPAAPKPPHAGLFGMSTSFTMHMVYSLKGHSSSVTASGTPTIEISVVGVPWADPAHITPVIIRLQPNADQRVVGSQDTKVGTFSGEQTTYPFADDRVPASVESLSKGRFRITPSQSLPPGEYAVALRDPDVKAFTRKSTDTSATGISQQQMYQTYVWDFSVSATGQP